MGPWGGYVPVCQLTHQWFFTWLSVRPGRRLAISLHLFPSSLFNASIDESFVVGHIAPLVSATTHIHTGAPPP